MTRAELGHGDEAVQPHDWPYTWRCLDCGYVGWPNTTDLRPGFRQSCPRSQDHQEMVHLKITGWETDEADLDRALTDAIDKLHDGSVGPDGVDAP